MPVSRAYLEVVGGPVLVLDAQGRATYTIPDDATGTITFEATATDAAGNTTDPVQFVLTIRDPNNAAPAVALTSPADRAVITAPTDVLGTVTDTDLVSYTLSYAPLDSDDFHPFATGTQTVPTAAVLGRFDPTILANGPYVIRLEATDGQNTSRTEQVVNVDGDLKLGNFKMSFTDLTIPVSGIPITITRSYDTLRADTQDDFGYGWKMEMSNTEVKVTHKTSALSGFGDYVSYRDGDRVLITLPDGTQEGFTFYGAVAQSGPGFITDYKPAFLPDPTVRSKLGVPDVWLRKVGDEYIDGYGQGYSPERPEFGDSYTLTTRSGIQYTIRASTGELWQITDRNNNTLTFTGMGIESSAGRSVQFERDWAGRITALIDPRGNRMTYNYDSQGNLIALTDRAQATTTFTYLTEPAHYLNQVLDSYGRPATRNQYDEDGRIKRIIGPEGNAMEYVLNLAGRTQSIADPLGYTSVQTLDARGNVVREEAPEARTVKREFDAEDRLLSETIVVGLEDSPTNGESDDQRIRYVYDSVSGFLLQAIIPRGHSTRTTYDEYGQPLTMTDALGNTTTDDYDARGLLDRVRDVNANVAHFESDAKGNLTDVLDGAGVPLGSIAYNQFGDATSTTTTTNVQGSDPATRTAYSAYDSNGNQVATWYFSSDDQILDVTYYDESDRVTGGRHLVLPEGRHITENLTSTDFAGPGYAQYTLWVSGTLYDPIGRVVRSTDQYGNASETSYDAGGRAIQSRTQARQVMQSDGTTADRWLLTRTVYDAKGRAILTTDPFVEHEVITDLNDAAYNPVTQTYGSFTFDNTTSSRATFFVYDGADRVVESLRLKDVIVDVVGTSPNYRTEIRVGNKVFAPPAGASGEQFFTALKDFFQSRGNVVSSSSDHYDNAGRVTLLADQYGNETRSLYNAEGDLIQTATQSEDESGNPVWLLTRTIYDDYGRVQLVTDQFAGQASSPDAIAGVQTHAARTIYDGQGRGVKTVRLKDVIVDVAGGNTALAASGTEVSTTETVYNAKGQVARTIAADGQVTQFEYDSLGRQWATVGHAVPLAQVGLATHPLASDPNPAVSVSLRSETVYDAEGRVEKERSNLRQFVRQDSGTTIDDSAVQETSYTYDEFGRRTRMTFEDGSYTLTRYDDFGRPVAQSQQYDAQTSAGWSDTEHSFVVTASTSPDHPVGTVIPTRLHEYDGDGRLTAVELPKVPDPDNAGALTRPRYEYGYDAQGHQTLIRDPLGRETRFAYDLRGNQLSRTLPLGFGPDGARGTQDDTSLPEGDFTERFEYDDLGRETLRVSFEGKYAKPIYDDQTGRLKEQRFYNNQAAYDGGTVAETWSYKYDSFGRQVEVRQDAGATIRTVTTAFDAEGRVKEIASPEGTVNYRYDALGRKRRTFTGSEADPVNDTYYGYDALGRLTSVEVHERNNVVLSTPERTTYSYDLLGNLDLAQKPGPVVDDYTYDALNRLDTLRQFKDSNANGQYESAVDAILAEYDYTVRSDGRRSAVTETFWFDDTGDNLLDPHENRVTWIYDNVGRLTDEVFDHYDSALDQTEHFLYDLVGNRRTQTLDKGNNGVDDTTTYSYDANDRLTLEEWDSADPGTTPDKTTTYGYDRTQQTLKEVRENGTLTSRVSYAYDLQGRMQVATVTSYTSGVASRIERTTYDYDAHGIRVSALHEVDAMADGTFESATKTEYFNDPANPTGYSQVLQETVSDPSTGQIQKRVVYSIGLDQISQTTITYVDGLPQSSETLVFNVDGHGSTRVLTDLVGAIATVSGLRQIFHFDAYGNALGFNPAVAGTSFLYNNEQFDAGIGEHYFRARYYDARTGRFNRLDPHAGNPADPLSLHKYLFPHADPINGIDPTGREFSLAGMLSGITIQNTVQAMYLGAVAAARIGAGAALGYHFGAHIGMYIGFLDGWMEDPNNLDLAFERMEAARYYGGIFGAVEGVMNAVLPCAFMLGWNLAWGIYGAIDQFSAAVEAYEKGDPLLAMWKAGLGASSLFLAIVMARACFVAGTPLLTPDGEKPIEQFKPGDMILSRQEDTPEGPLVARRVVQTFQRMDYVTRVTVGEHTIETTAEHPFFAIGKGWVKAAELGKGDRLIGHDGCISVVSDVQKTDRFEPVYNLQVEEDSTYFVGQRDLRWSVWAHNMKCGQSRRITPVVDPDNGMTYTHEIKWNAGPPVRARPGDGPNQFWGKRIRLTDPSAEALEQAATGGSEESYFVLVRKDGRNTFVQFESKNGNVLVDAKHVESEGRGINHLGDPPDPWKERIHKGEIDRQVQAAEENGYTVQWVFDDAEAAAQMQAYFNRLGVSPRMTAVGP